MEKFTEYHEGKNRISIEDANYLVSAYGLSSVRSKVIQVPIERDIFLDIKAHLTALRDALIVDSMIYIASVGEFSMAYPTIDKARKGLAKLEDQHIASMFGARV